MQTISNPIELHLAYISTSKRPSFWQKLFNKEQQSNYAAVFTPGEGSGIILPIVIGAQEAQGLVIVAEGLVPSRPLLPDLFKAATDQFGYKLEFIIIHKIDEKGIFYAAMHYSNGEKKVELDARPSDAVTAALYAKAPVLIEQELLNKHGIRANPV
jgi:bifunctional DNase/RNase